MCLDYHVHKSNISFSLPKALVPINVKYSVAMYNNIGSIDFIVKIYVRRGDRCPAHFN